MQGSVSTFPLRCGVSDPRGRGYDPVTSQRESRDVTAGT